jgi:hypothetical protein
MNNIAQSQETFAQHLLQVYAFTEHFAELEELWLKVLVLHLNLFQVH